MNKISGTKFPLVESYKSHLSSFDATSQKLTKPFVLSHHIIPHLTLGSTRKTLLHVRNLQKKNLQCLVRVASNRCAPAGQSPDSVVRLGRVGSAEEIGALDAHILRSPLHLEGDAAEDAEPEEDVDAGNGEAVRDKLLQRPPCHHHGAFKSDCKQKCHTCFMLCSMFK